MSAVFDEPIDEPVAGGGELGVHELSIMYVKGFQRLVVGPWAVVCAAPEWVYISTRSAEWKTYPP